MDIIYRSAREADAEKIVAFYNRVGGETTYLSFEKNEYPLDAAAQRQAICIQKNDPANRMLLAMDEDEIAGIATVSSSHKVKMRHTAELGIVIARNYQGKGIGTELIARLIACCRQNGITKKISLITREDNTSAVRLYEKFGFETEGCLKRNTLIDGTYYNALMMALFL